MAVSRQSPEFTELRETADYYLLDNREAILNIAENYKSQPGFGDEMLSNSHLKKINFCRTLDPAA